MRFEYSCLLYAWISIVHLLPCLLFRPLVRLRSYVHMPYTFVSSILITVVFLCNDIGTFSPVLYFLEECNQWIYVVVLQSGSCGEPVAKDVSTDTRAYLTLSGMPAAGCGRR